MQLSISISMKIIFNNGDTLLHYTSYFRNKEQASCLSSCILDGLWPND